MDFWTHHIIQGLATSLLVLVPGWFLLRGHCKCLEKKMIELVIAVMSEMKGGEDK